MAPSRIFAPAVALLLAVGLAACGSSSGSSSTSTASGQANARRGFLQDPQVQACLKKEGVQVPQFRRGNGQPPSGGNEQRPPGGGARNSAQFEKVRKALQKCGVTLPNRPPQQQSTTSSDTTNS